MLAFWRYYWSRSRKPNGSLEDTLQCKSSSPNTFGFYAKKCKVATKLQVLVCRNPLFFLFSPYAKNRKLGDLEVPVFCFGRVGTDWYHNQSAPIGIPVHGRLRAYFDGHNSILAMHLLDQKTGLHRFILFLPLRPEIAPR